MREQDDTRQQQRELEDQGWVIADSSEQCVKNCPDCRRGDH